MIEKIASITAEVQSAALNSKQQVEEFRLKYLSKKGLIPSLFEDFKTVPNDLKKAMGAEINKLKQLAESLYCFQLNAIGSLVIQKRDRVSMQPSDAGNIRDLHFSFAHQAGEVAANHFTLNVNKLLKTSKSD